MAFMFENLAVYQKAIDFAEQVVTLTESFPRGYYFLTDQLNRASLSIATNPAEGRVDSQKPTAGTSSSSPEDRHKNACLCWNSRDERACWLKHRIDHYESRSKSSPR